MSLLMVVLTSALFAGLVATCATVAVERLGGKLGGVLATTPSTIIAAAAVSTMGLKRMAPASICPSGAWARGWR